jgi:hypothetical protein
VRYRIEYLLQTSDAGAVYESADIEANLQMAELKARLNSENAKRAFHAGGFQIRDLDNGGLIVALERFEDPLARFWPDPGNHIVH